MADISSLTEAANPKDRTMGVYRIVNRENSKFYVGSSKRMGRRAWTHLSHLRSGKHHCIALQRAFDKYGEGAFRFEIFCTCDSDVEFLFIEQAMLDERHGDDDCYNSSAVAESPLLTKDVQEKARLGRIASDKFREHASRQIAKLQAPEMRSAALLAMRQSEAFMGNVRAQGERLRKALSIPVVATRIETGEEFRFPSAKAAMRHFGFGTSALISKCIQGKVGKAYGFTWRRDVI